LLTHENTLKISTQEKIRKKIKELFLCYYDDIIFDVNPESEIISIAFYA